MGGMRTFALVEPEGMNGSVPLLTGRATFFEGLLLPDTVDRHYRTACWHAFSAFYGDEATVERFAFVVRQSPTARIGNYRDLQADKEDKSVRASDTVPMEGVSQWRTLSEFEWSAFYLYDPRTGFLAFKYYSDALILNDACGIGSQLLGEPITQLLVGWENGPEFEQYGRLLAGLTGP